MPKHLISLFKPSCFPNLCPSCRTRTRPESFFRNVTYKLTLVTVTMILSHSDLYFLGLEENIMLTKINVWIRKVLFPFRKVFFPFLSNRKWDWFFRVTALQSSGDEGLRGSEGWTKTGLKSNEKRKEKREEEEEEKRGWRQNNVKLRRKRRGRN